MIPVIRFPAGPLDPETACALAYHERNHLAFARDVAPELRARLEASILEFERAHGVEGRAPDSRRVVSWACDDAAVNQAVAGVPKPR